MTALRLGTRKSALALAQSTLVADAIRSATGREVELVHVTTIGDVKRESLASIGGTGVFVSALRDALLTGEIDLAVHSLKDLPTTELPDLELIAIPERADARDALVARDGLTLESLPNGATVGTGSPRRAAQLKAMRPDLDVVDIRGNVGTRIGLVESGRVDAVVLAKAGLQRLGRLDVITETIAPSVMLPAPGQGALAVEVVRDLAGDDRHAPLRRLDDAATRAAVTAERAVLSALEAGCSAPVGALGVVSELGFSEPELTLEALVASPDGSSVVRMSTTAPLHEADAAGRQLAARLLDSGVTATSREHL
ncbi:MAG: hydroxymethylbilane synthase [Actinomycetia bacterium]|nr:hydroxymethylbilane synthase [Actinomycetes bacterium]